MKISISQSKLLPHPVGARTQPPSASQKKLSGNAAAFIKDVMRKLSPPSESSMKTDLLGGQLVSAFKDIGAQIRCNISFHTNDYRAVAKVFLIMDDDGTINQTYKPLIQVGVGAVSESEADIAGSLIRQMIPADFKSTTPASIAKIISHAINTSAYVAENAPSTSSGKTTLKISVLSASMMQAMSADGTALAAANMYLNNDGMIDVAKFQALQKKIDAAAKKADLTKPSGVYCVLKKLPAKFSAAMFKKADHKYLLSRSIEVKKYARMPKVARPMILVSYDGLPAALNAEIKKAISAIVQHNKKAPKQKESVKTEKAKIRDQNAKDFDKNLDHFLPRLQEIGVKEKDVFIGQGMFGGKQVFVTLPNKGIITIGASNAEALKKAKAAARKAGE